MDSNFQNLNLEELSLIFDKLSSKLKEFTNLKKEFVKQQEKILFDISNIIPIIDLQPPTKKQRTNTLSDPLYQEVDKSKFLSKPQNLDQSLNQCIEQVNEKQNKDKDTNKKKEHSKDKQDMLFLTSLSDLNTFSSTPKLIYNDDDNNDNNDDNNNDCNINSFKPSDTPKVNNDDKNDEQIFNNYYDDDDDDEDDYNTESE